MRGFTVVQCPLCAAFGSTGRSVNWQYMWNAAMPISPWLCVPDMIMHAFVVKTCLLDLEVNL
jgi:hypothetical protein